MSAVWQSVLLAWVLLPCTYHGLPGVMSKLTQCWARVTCSLALPDSSLNATLLCQAVNTMSFVLYAQGLSFIYIMWRACRSCVGGWYYLFSIPVLIAEIANALMGVLFMTGVWNQLERPPR